MLVSDEPNASQLFEQLEQLTIASDQSLLYLIDMDALLQLEHANVYPASLPLSMSSMQSEYWRSAYDTMRLQWAVMDKLRSRHGILKQAAAEFWPAPPPVPPPTATTTTEASDAVSLPAAQSVKQDESMDNSSTAPSSGGVDTASNTNSSAATQDSHNHQPISQHIDLTQHTADNSTVADVSPRPAIDATQSGGEEAMVDTHFTTAAGTPQAADSSPQTPSILLTPQPPQSILLTPTPPQQSSPLMPQPAESPSRLDRPEFIESARSVMDLTDDV